MTETPAKDELPRELQRLLTTLTEEAQHAAIRKVVEVGFDPNKGRISLEETLINLTQGRDILLDAIEKRKFVQLPLKLQFALYEQVQAIANDLTTLVNGTDAVQNLDTAVEELNASVWQFQLHNLSDQVIGFQSKMNQLKSQETAIRQASRAAEQFNDLRQKADQALDAIAERAKTIADESVSVSKVVEQLQTTLRESTEISQKVASSATQIAQHETTAAQQLASAKQASADTEAIAAKSKEMRGEIEAFRTSLQDLTSKTQELITTTERSSTAQLAEFQATYEQLREKTDTNTTTLTAKLDTSIAELTTQTNTKIESLTDSTENRLESLATSTETRTTSLLTDVSQRLISAENAQQARLASQLTDFTTKSDTVVQAFVEKGEESHAKGEAEVKRLVGQLDELEGRIHEALERATGYTLFHAFQRRQQDIVVAKNFWARALAVCVGISLVASGVFIWSLQFVEVYSAAFYLKLSISVPLIYAIAFCNLQYSRERKLEEEYAFKSSVSISLDPYQKLVGTLIDKANPAEVTKYTEFIIQSVNRVFTSPTGPVFEGQVSDKNSAEKIIKAMGDVIEPVIKGLRR